MKQKFLLKGLLVAILLLCTSHSWAYDFSEENDEGVTIYYDVVSSADMTCSVTYKNTNYNSYSGNVIIPETVTYKESTYSVTSIGGSAFRSCSGLTTVIIPNNVTSIGRYAFYNCTCLTSVNIPDGVTSIGSWAFYCCWGLTGELVIPNGIRTIEDNTFRSCSGLTGELKIPNSVTSIGDCAFMGCSGLTGELKIPDSVTTIAYEAFYGCSGLTSLHIGNSVTTLESQAFRGCTSLTSVTLGNGVTSIGGWAFYGCSSLTELTLEDGEETLSFAKSSTATPFSSCPIETLYLGRDISFGSNYSPFRDSTYLTSLTIGNKVTTISEYEFYNCAGLMGELKIPDSVITVGDYAFESCTSLSSLILGNSVTDIGSRAFYDCTSLVSLSLGNSVTTIGDYAFYHCQGLTELIIPDSVTTIGDSAFRGCSNLTSLTLGNSVTTIGEDAFYNCSSLIDLILEDGEGTLLMTISRTSYTPFTSCPIETLYLGRDISYNGNYSPFRDNKNLVSLTIGNKVTTISNCEFDNCSSLTGELKIPNSVTTIGESAFYGCSGLTSLTLGNSVEAIDYYAFYNCSSLTCELKIPDSVTTIDRYAFYQCSGLTSITIGNSVATIGEYVFYRCSSMIGELKIPDSVTSIGSSAFEYCTGLTSLTIGNSVTTIGDRAFYGCSGLSGDLVIPNSMTSIDTRTFYNCSSLTSVDIPNSLSSIGEYAFYGCSSLKALNIEDGEETLSFTTSSSATPFSSCPIDTLYLGRNISYSTSNYSPFRGKTNLTSLTIGNKVTNISSYEFYGCTKLAELVIPNNVITIDTYAFGSSSIKILTIEDDDEPLSMITNSSNTPFTDCAIEAIYWGRNINYEYSPFRGNAYLVSLTIGNKIKVIDNYEFYNCSSLTSLTLGNSVTTIGSRAFYDCTSLVSLSLGNSVTTIGDYAFYHCQGLTELIIPDSVTTIGDSAFRGCSNLTSLTLGNSVTTIGEDAFYNCSSLIDLILEDGDGILTLSTNSSYTPFTSCPIETLYLGRDIVFSDSSYSSFKDKTNLTSLTIGESVTCIPSGTFSGCTKLIDITALCTTPPTIYSDTFSDVESVNAPKEALLDYVTADYWYYIRKIYAEDNGKLYYPVPIIYEGDPIAMADGGSVNGVVAQKGDKVCITPLSGNSQVEGVVVYRAEDITEDINKNGFSSFEVTEFHLTNRVYTYGFDAEHYFDITLASAGQLLEELTVYNVPMVYGLKVTGEVNGTDIMTIRKMPYIQQLDLSDATIVSGGDPYYDYYETIDNVIGKYFFIDMPNLKYVKLPKDITSIENYAFSDLTGLTGISIPGSVTLVEEYAFKGCSCLASLVLEDGSETLALTPNSSVANSLTECPFVSLYLGRDLDYSYKSSGKTYYSSPFKDKTMLTFLIISDSVTEIGADEFNGCTGLMGVTIPKDVTSIGNSAFANCLHVAEVDFNAIVCESAGNASYPIFSGCSILEKITIGEGVTIIPDYLFYSCSCEMERLSIPDQVITIGNSAFRDFTKLEKLTIGESVENIGSQAFYSCSQLSTINSKNPTPPDITNNTFYGADKGTCVLNVPFGSLNDYWIHLYWGLFFHINEVDFGYEELKEEIETTQDLLEDVWDTINSDYSDVVNEFMNEYENLKKQLEELLEVLEIAYRNGDLTDEKIAEIRQELEEIKQKIDELLANAKSSSKFTDIDNIHSNVDDNVQIYNLSGSRVNTPRKGNVYIFRFSDGTTKKVFIK